MNNGEPARNAQKRVSRLLLTGWSLVRVRPGEPINLALSANPSINEVARGTAGVLKPVSSTVNVEHIAARVNTKSH